MDNLPTVSIKAQYEQILEILKRNKFNKSKTAKILGIDRKTLYNKLNKYEKLVGHN